MSDRLRAAAQAALEAIEELEYSSSTAVADKMARDAKRLLRAALAETEPCWCDRQQIGEPGVSCGDRPTRDYQLRGATEMIDDRDSARAALGEQEVEQEPVAWMDCEGDIYPMPERPGWAPPHTLLYTAPPSREWKGLTDENRIDAFNAYLEQTSEERSRFRAALSYSEEERESFDAGWAAAEAALRERNA